MQFLDKAYYLVRYVLSHLVQPCTVAIIKVYVDFQHVFHRRVFAAQAACWQHGPVTTTSVFGRQTFPDLCLKWARSDNFDGKLSATGKSQRGQKISLPSHLGC